MYCDKKESERIQANASKSTRVMAHVFKSDNITLTWYVNTKTLQLQGSYSEQICLQLSKLVKHYAKKQGHFQLQGPTAAENDNGPAMASACDKLNSIMENLMQSKGQGYQNDEDCCSFKSESEYDYSFIDKVAILTNIISLVTVVVTSPSIAQMISVTIIGKNSSTSGQQ